MSGDSAVLAEVLEEPELVVLPPEVGEHREPDGVDAELTVAVWEGGRTAGVEEESRGDGEFSQVKCPACGIYLVLGVWRTGPGYRCRCR